MQMIHSNRFGARDQTDALAIARNLGRIYADVLEEPIPPELQRLIERLQERIEERSSAGR